MSIYNANNHLASNCLHTCQKHAVCGRLPANVRGSFCVFIPRSTWHPVATSVAGAHVISPENTEFIQLQLQGIVVVGGNSAIFSSHQSSYGVVNAVARIADVHQYEIFVLGIVLLLVREAFWNENLVASKRHRCKARHTYFLGVGQTSARQMTFSFRNAGNSSWSRMVNRLPHPPRQRWHFVYLFVYWNKTRKNYITPPLKKEINLMRVVSHGQRHKPRRVYQRQRHCELSRVESCRSAVLEVKWQ